MQGLRMRQSMLISQKLFNPPEHAIQKSFRKTGKRTLEVRKQTRARRFVPAFFENNKQ
jgi:hypothetical protein